MVVVSLQWWLPICCVIVLVCSQVSAERECYACVWFLEDSINYILAFLSCLHLLSALLSSGRRSTEVDELLCLPQRHCTCTKDANQDSNNNKNQQELLQSSSSCTTGAPPRSLEPCAVAPTPHPADPTAFSWINITYRQAEKVLGGFVGFVIGTLNRNGSHFLSFLKKVFQPGCCCSMS